MAVKIGGKALEPVAQETLDHPTTLGSSYSEAEMPSTKIKPKPGVTVTGPLKSELSSALQAIRKQLGEKSVMSGSEVPNVQRQPTGVFEFDLALGGGFPYARYSIVYGPESSGKCHARGDKVLTYSGHARAVEDVLPGDVLMGPDSRPRVVQAIGGGFGQLYRVSPVKGGGEFTVNADHQLHLVCTHDQGSRRKGDKVQVSVKDYLDKPMDWKIYHHLYRVGVEYPHTAPEIDPYFLGLWLGDGSSSNMQVYSVSLEIVDWLQTHADVLGGRLSKYDANSACPGYAIVGTGLRSTMEGMGLFRGKHIPGSYMRNSRQVRLQLLAGLIDTDGAKGSGPSCCFYNSNELLCQQVRALAQSLGYYAAVSPKQTSCNGRFFDSWVVYVSMDDPDELPLLLEYKRPSQRTRGGSCLTSRFDVTPVGEGEFFGFEVDQDHLYLTEGLIVNHNTNIVYKAIAQVQRRPPPCNKAVFVDLEGTFDPSWAMRFGVDVDELVVAKPSYGEQAVDMIDALVRVSDVAFLAVDSIAVMIAAREVEGSTEKADVGTSALLIKRMANKLAIALSEEQKRGHEVCVVLLNQTRFKIGVMFGNPETMPGGQTVKFNASLIVRISGKNTVVKEISATVPALKETHAIVKKAKIGIVQGDFKYDMAMMDHDGLMVGETNSFPQVKAYLQASGHIVKGQSGGWVCMGKHFPTLAVIQDTYRADDEYALMLQQQVIKNHQLALVPAQPLVGPEDVDGVKAPDDGGL